MPPSTFHLCLALAICWLATIPQAHAQTASGGGLNEKARLQMEALRQEKESLTPAQRKIHTQLLHAARQAATGVAVAGVPSLHPNVALEADGRVKVKIKADVTEELLGVIKAQGGTVIASFPAVPRHLCHPAAGEPGTVAANPRWSSSTPRPRPLHNNGAHKKTSATQTDPAHAWIAQTQALQNGWSRRPPSMTRKAT